MPSLEPFTAIPITAGILTNVASDILKHHAQSLDGTPAGRMLKWAGLIEPNLLDRLRDVLKKTLELYFKLYPERELPGIDDFFRDPVITEQISGYILCRLPVDTAKIQQAWERHLSSERLTQVLIRYKGLEPERIIGDFLECYRQVLREQLSVPQIAILLDLLEQNQALVAELQASEERMRAYITGLMESKLSPQALGSAYQSGQQELATSLAEEMNAAGLVQTDHAVQTIQTRLQHLPALFKDGLCKGRPLSIAANQYFVSHGFPPDMLEDWRETLTETLAHTSGSEEPLQPYFVGDTLLGGFRLCGIIEKLYATRFCTFLLPPSLDRNVYLELGIAIGLEAPFFLIQHYEAEIPSVLDGLSRYAKGGLFRTMRRELAGQIEEYDFGVVRFVANLSAASNQPKYLIAAGGLIEDEDFEGSIKEAIESAYPQIEAISLTEQLTAGGSGWVLEQLVEAIQTSRFAIYRLDEACSPTTFLALGISIGLNRPFLMVHKTNTDVPLDLRGMGIYQFPNFVTLRKEIVSRHQKFFERYA